MTKTAKRRARTPEKPAEASGHVWRSKIVGHDRVAPDQLVANPLNFRTHPQAQRDALKAAIQEIGFLQEMLAGLAKDAGLYEAPEPPAVPVTKPGDLWLLGEHRLLCGDSTKPEDVARVMNGERAGLCFTSPPYAQQRDYGKKIDDWDGLMRGVFANLPMLPDGQVLVNLGLVHREGEWWPYWEGWIEWMRAQGWRRFGWYVWDQGSGLPGDWNGRFAPSHEFVFHFNRDSTRPDKTIPKNLKSGPMGTNMRGASGVNGARSSVCTDRNNSRFSCSAPDTLRRSRFSFPPDSLPADCYEPFAGSGTTIIAAQQLNCRCFAIDLEPRYVDVAVARWEKLTGQKARLDNGT